MAKEVNPTTFNHTYEFSYYAKAGYLNSKLNNKNYTNISGFYGGLTTVIVYTKNPNLSLETGLVFSQRGFEIPETRINNTSIVSLGYNVRANYIDLPVNISYSFRDKDEFMSFTPSLGLYLSCGVGGQVKQTTGQDGTGYKPEYSLRFEKNDSSDPSLYRLDWGAKAGLGFQIGRIIIEATYTMGLRPVIYPYSNFAPQSKYQVISAGVGFEF